jgi:hypothetical protein
MFWEARAWRVGGLYRSARRGLQFDGMVKRRTRRAFETRAAAGAAANAPPAGVIRCPEMPTPYLPGRLGEFCARYE